MITIGIIIFSKPLNLIGSFHTFPCVCTKLNDLIGINSSLVTINKSPGKTKCVNYSHTLFYHSFLGIGTSEICLLNTKNGLHKYLQQQRLQQSICVS